MNHVPWAALAAQMLLPGVIWCQIGNIVVTSAASFQPGVPAKGSIGTIFCTGLTVTGVVSAPSAPLPFSLSGVAVTMGGAAAPLFAVTDLDGYQQINFQVPLEAKSSPDGTMQVVVGQNGRQGSATADKPIRPGDFFRIGSTPFGAF